MTASYSGDDISCPKITTAQTEERLVRDEITNDIYLALSSTKVLKRTKNAVCHCRFEEKLNNNAPVDSKNYATAIPQSALDRKKTSPANIFKVDNPLNFQIQVANT